MDRIKAKRIINDVDDALKSIAKKHSLTTSVSRDSFVGNCRFTPTGLDMKVSFVDAETKKGETVTYPEQNAFKAYAYEFGLDPDWLGQTYVSGGHEYTVFGLKTRAKKYKVLIKRNDGRLFKITPGALKGYMVKF